MQDACGITNPRLALDTAMGDWQLNIAPDGRANSKRIGAGIEKIRAVTREVFGQHLTGTPAPLGSPTLLDALAGFRIGGAARSPALVDSVAEVTSMSDEKRLTFDLFQEHTGALWPEPSPAQVAERIAATYVSAAVPALIASPAEVVLSWRDLLGESLQAFHAEVALLVTDAHGIEEGDVPAFLAHVTPQLEIHYRQLREQAESSQLRNQVAEHLPDWIGEAGGIGLLHSAAGGSLDIAVAGAGVGVLLAAALRSLVAKAAVERHPPYWRLAIDAASLK